MTGAAAIAARTRAAGVRLQSALDGVAWPPVPGSGAARVLTQLLYLEQSQWLSTERLRRGQDRQLACLVRHAWATVPWYRERLRDAGLDGAAPFERERFERLAPLTRRELQVAGAELESAELPADHGARSPRMTSGSTGAPVRVQGSGLTSLFWRALTLRDHLWHRRDLDGSLATIRHSGRADAAPPRGVAMPDWGAATRGVVRTGPGFLLGIASNLSQQLAWLRDVAPRYLLAYPSTVRALLGELRRRGERLPGLAAVRTFGESVDTSLREEVREVLGVGLVDVYSAQETGYLALQCPSGSGYHVQAESVVVEVVDEAGRTCAPGEVGRVLVTALHNFATPLLRYEIGDYARVGAPCPCGRGLPVLSEVLGRQRNMAVLPDGDRRWPSFGQGDDPRTLPPFHQVQLVQRRCDTIDVYVVRDAPLDPAEEARASAYLRQAFGYPFRFAFHRVDGIPRGAGGKYEDFRCELESEGRA